VIERRREVALDARALKSACQGRAIVGLGAGVIAGGGTQQAALVARVGILRIEGQRALERRGSAALVARLALERAKIGPRADIARHARDEAFEQGKRAPALAGQRKLVGEAPRRRAVARIEPHGAFEGFARAGVVALPAAHGRAAIPCGGGFRVERERAREGGGGAVEHAGIAADRAEIDQQRHAVGRQRRGTFEQGRCLCMDFCVDLWARAAAVEREGEVAERVGRIGRARRRRAERFDRVAQPAVAVEHDAERAMGDRLVRDRDRTAQCRLRAIELAEREARHAEIVPGETVAGRERRGALEQQRRLGVAPRIAIGDAEIAEHRRRLGRERGGALEPRHGLRNPTGANHQLGSEMQRLDVIGRRRERALDQRRRRVQLPLLRRRPRRRDVRRRPVHAPPLRSQVHARRDNGINHRGTETQRDPA
jgi:hypothetical protein